MDKYVVEITDENLSIYATFLYLIADIPTIFLNTLQK